MTTEKPVVFNGGAIVQLMKTKLFAGLRLGIEFSKYECSRKELRGKTNR